MTTQELRNSLKANHQLHWYRIERVLGQGGFGITYLAHDPNLDQHVAIKEYLPMELAVRDGDDSVYPASSANGDRYRWGLDRFIVEARTLAKFKHPAIVRVLSVFEENNTAYMVMEFEQGESLQQVLDRRKTLDEDELIPILAPLLDGLELIHSTGFIHRDIKPANIYIREDGSPVLLDFGSARQALGEQTKSLTSIVSPGYAPFEQYYSKSDRQGPWTDIYSLAATMYRAISGVMPMDAIDRSEAILKAERDIFVTAGEIGHGRYSAQFMQALDHALNFSEKKRPQTIGEWRAELGIETRNSAPVSRPASVAQPSKTRFDAAPVSADDIETQLAEEVLPSVRNADVASAQILPARPRNVPAAPEQPGRRSWWIGAAAIAVVALGIAAWNQSGSTPLPLFDEIKAAIAGLMSGGDEENVDRLVSRGDRALSAGRDFEPIEGSAVDYYRRAVRIAPQHGGALQGIALVAPRMLSAAEQAIAAGNLSRAEELLQVLRSLPGQQQAVAPLEEEFAQARAALAADAVQQSRIEEFLNEAATDVAEGRILAPSGNNALVRYRAIQMLDPDNADAKRGVAAIVSRLSEEFDAAVTGGDFTLADERLRQIVPIIRDQERLEQMGETLATARKNDAAAAQRDAKVTALLNEAEVDLQANRLATPAGRNALDRYKEVLKLDPDNVLAAEGLVKVTERYVKLARGAIRNRQIDAAKGYIARAKSLDAPGQTLQELSAQLKDLQDQAVAENAQRTLEQEKQRLAEESRQRQEQEHLKRELEAARETAALEKRRRQEAEAKRLFELEQNKAHALEEQQAQADEAIQRSTLVVEFDGFDDQLEIYGLKRREVRADIEERLRKLGYNIVLHHHANRSSLTRLFVVRFRANLNSASGVFSYAASLSLYDRVPVMANSARKSGLRPIWDKGTTGVAQQTDLRRVREEYKRTMRQFTSEVGQAPGRL